MYRQRSRRRKPCRRRKRKCALSRCAARRRNRRALGWRLVKRRGHQANPLHVCRKWWEGDDCCNNGRRRRCPLEADSLAGKCTPSHQMVTLALGFFSIPLFFANGGRCAAICGRWFCRTAAGWLLDCFSYCAAGWGGLLLCKEIKHKCRGFNPFPLGPRKAFFQGMATAVAPALCGRRTTTEAVFAGKTLRYRGAGHWDGYSQHNHDIPPH